MVVKASPQRQKQAKREVLARKNQRCPGEVPELDRLIHERVRLGMVSALATNSSLSFHDLKRILRTSDGNLSVHARKLEEAQYVSCAKYFQGRIPRTEYRLTAAGRQAFEQYLQHMQQLIHRMREE